MSWLFGKKGSDDEDEYESYSEGEGEDEYASSEEEGEDGDEEDEVKEKSKEDADEREEKPKETEPEAATENGHAPPSSDENPKEEEEEEAAPSAGEPTAEASESSDKPAELKEEPKEEETPEPKAESSTEAPEESTSAETVEANTADSEAEEEEMAAEEEEETPKEAEKEEEEISKAEDDEKKEESTSKDKPEENADPVAKEEETTEDPDDEKEKDDSETKVETVTEDEDEEEEEKPAETNDKKEEEEVEEVTSTHEKRSLLVLAAEHDRVDILKAILADDSEDRDTLLNSSIPPLHISIAYGSTNAVQSLLRMGADPSVRPNIEQIKADAQAEGEEQLVDIPNMGRFDKLSAWELAFGKEGEQQEEKKKSSGWFGGGKSNSSGIDIAPSKLEGIRHAFTAEGLRCIGSDEVDRLKQLIDSGMPSTIDIGGKNLYDWAVEMGALQCEELLRSGEADRSSKEEAEKDSSKEGEEKEEKHASAVRERSAKDGTETLSQLNNRIDELENLSKALSTCLDNLAEEVSVCHGLLLMGGGASALASHVRSLKTLKENKMAELERLEEAWENSEDELAYWVKEAGELGKEISESMTTDILPSNENENPKTLDGSPEDEQAHIQQVKAQASLLENKIIKLRASITDLSEESARDLEEVEKRGLSGGIKLVRSLRDEIREVEFALNEARNGESLCHAKIAMIQLKLNQPDKQSTATTMTTKPTESNGEAAPIASTEGATAGDAVIQTSSQTPAESSSEASAAVSQGAEATSKVETAANPAPSTPVPGNAMKKPSESVVTGQSSAITLKEKARPGYFTVDLWKILLRIIGLGPSPKPKDYQSSAASNVMIV